MSTALYIVLEDESPGIETDLDGTALSQVEPVLQQIAVAAGVKPLMEFFGAGGEAYADLFEDAEIEAPEAQWYEAAAGLQTIRAILRHVEQQPNQLQYADAVVADLQNMERILVEAESRQIRWHLAVDF